MKPIVVAGNGPSLAQIDYSLLPEDFDVFRCNQFYFEDRYFLGKKIKGVFFNHRLTPEFFFTMNQLQNRQEYEIRDLYSCLYPFDCKESSFEYFQKLKCQYPTIIDFYPFLQKYKEIYQQIQIWYSHKKKFLNMGTYMLISALAQGYSEIYLTGMDFYLGDKHYAFDMQNKQNLFSRVPGFQIRQKTINCDQHCLDFDLSIIKLIQKMGICNLYTLSSCSILSDFLPLGTQKNIHSFKVENKQEDYIKDLLIPQEVQQDIFESSKNPSLISKMLNFITKGKTK